VRLLNRGPWRKRDRTIVVVGCALGLFGWASAAGAAVARSTCPTKLHWLVGGIVSVALSSLGLAYWLLSGLRTVRLETAGVFGAVTANRAPATVAAGSAGLVTAAGMVRYHCPSARWWPARRSAKLDAATIAAEGLRVCGACG